MSRECNLSIAEEILQLMPESERDRSLIYDRVYCSSKLEPLSSKYEISKERIRQIEKKFLIATLRHLRFNPDSTIRNAQERPYCFKPEDFSVINWYSAVGINMFGEFPEKTLFHGRCAFECFLLLSKKLQAIKGYDNLKYCIPDSVSAYLSRYQLYYQASPIRKDNALEDSSEHIWRYIKRYGLVHLDYVVRNMKRPKMIVEKALKIDGYIVLDGDWYIHPIVMLDNRGVFKLSLEKMFAVADSISFEDVLKGLGRSINWNNEFRPDRKLVKKLLIAYRLSIKDNIVTWKKARKKIQLSLSKAEYAIVKATKAVGPVMSKYDMRYFLNSSGVAEGTLWNYLLDKSPIFIGIEDDGRGNQIKFHRLIGSEISDIHLERAYARNFLFTKRVANEQD